MICHFLLVIPKLMLGISRVQIRSFYRGLEMILLINNHIRKTIGRKWESKSRRGGCLGDGMRGRRIISSFHSRQLLHHKHFLLVIVPLISLSLFSVCYLSGFMYEYVTVCLELIRRVHLAQNRCSREWGGNGRGEQIGAYYRLHNVHDQKRLPCF